MHGKIPGLNLSDKGQTLEKVSGVCSRPGILGSGRREPPKEIGQHLAEFPSSVFSVSGRRTIIVQTQLCHPGRDKSTVVLTGTL